MDVIPAHYRFGTRPAPFTLVAFACVTLMSACGGGGGDSSPPPSGGGGGLPASSTLAQQCASNNSLAPAGNRTATLDTERRWVRSYMNEAYLWYSEVPAVDTALAAYNVPDVAQALDAYFRALRTPVITASGKRRDQFSFTFGTAAWNALSQSGVSGGFGAEWVLGSPTPPRNIRIAYVDPGTPAAAASLARGMNLVSVDGVSADDNSTTGVAHLNEALFSPVSGRSYTFVFINAANALVNATMTATQVTKTSVQNVRTIDTPSGRVGYFTFNDHLAPAEGALVSAFTQFAGQGVNDLVLDLRYNGGGYLYIASEVGYMVAGSARTTGRTFERLRFSDKRTADTNNPNNNTPFYNVTSGLAGSGTTANQPLPQLSLGRVFVLAGPDTCSASESIVNGLRGIGVQVALIGGTTCGKPYGFTAKDNCGISYFPIEFQGANDVGFSDYADGFAPTCAAADDLTRALGDPTEGLLAAALSYRATGVCPTATGRESPQSRASDFGRLIRTPAREGKFLR
jgi:carboxyl-terminal processing protease